jgi:hypothetical protein
MAFGRSIPRVTREEPGSLEPYLRCAEDGVRRLKFDRGDVRDLLPENHDHAGLATIARQAAKPRITAITKRSAVIATRRALCPASAASESNSSRSRFILRARFIAYPIPRRETLASRSKGQTSPSVPDRGWVNLTAEPGRSLAGRVGI